MESFVKVWKDSFNYAGRAQRKEYWMFTLFHIIVMMVLVGVGIALSGPESQVALLPAMLYSLVGILPSLAAGVRRMHDTGRSGWWLLISLVPAIGGIWFLVLTVLDSKPEANQWGPSPKYAGMAVV